MIKLKYVLVLLRYKDKYLLLNRNKPSWMGCWNGVGGKIEGDETPVQAAIRETKEETGLSVHIPNNYIRVLWKVLDEENSLGGMYCFLADLDSIFDTPIKSSEGILDFKDYDWIMNKANSGIAKNVPTILNALVNNIKKDYITIYKTKFDDFGEIKEINFLELEKEENAKRNNSSC